jgi:hypothetical protein
MVLTSESEDTSEVGYGIYILAGSLAPFFPKWKIEKAVIDFLQRLHTERTSRHSHLLRNSYPSIHRGRTGPYVANHHLLSSK